MKFYRYGLLAATLTLTACGGGNAINLSGKPVDGGTPTNPIAPSKELKLARVNSPYAANLIPCVQALERGNACSLNQLNFIYNDNPNPTIDDIMNRLVVSDDWMAKRFQEMLTHSNMPKTMLPLFQSVRAIVISAEIRPAFFSPYSGAIYLDPNYLWLTNAEKDTINKDDDYRGEFVKKFEFLSLQRFVYNNTQAFPAGSLYDKTQRSLGATIPMLASLLFHELAHARDTYHNSFLDTLTPSDERLSEIFENRKIKVINEQIFVETFKLTNKTMFALSQSLFKGTEPSAELKALTASDVGTMLEGEGANDQYAYYTGYEDFAMLFEESMMKKHYGIDRDVTYVEVPATTTPKCDDYVIGWGQRNRIAASEVRPRAEAVVKKALANTSGIDLLEVEQFFSNLGSPATLPLIGYCSAINPNSRSLDNSDYDPLQDALRY